MSTSKSMSEMEGLSSFSFTRKSSYQAINAAIAFPVVAFHAGQHAVGPAGRSPLSTWQHVIDGQLFASWTAAAVLTHKLVTLEHVAATESHHIVRRFVVMRQRDDFRHFEPQPLSLDDGFATVRNQLGPFVPGMLQKAFGVDDSCGLVPHLDQRPRYCGNADRPPAFVENQCWSIERRSDHVRPSSSCHRCAGAM